MEGSHSLRLDGFNNYYYELDEDVRYLVFGNNYYILVVPLSRVSSVTSSDLLAVSIDLAHGWFVTYHILYIQMKIM